MKRIILILLLLFFPKFAIASTQQEIEHLLDFVSNTNCKYERNGTIYKGQQARSHIEKKYRYYKDDIQSAEDFIKYSATKSTISGKKYKIHCPNKPVQESSEWLLRELSNFRKTD